MVCRLVYGKREISSTSLLCHHAQELQIICTVLHRAGAAFYGNTATEESVPQRDCVVRTCFASDLTPVVVPLLLISSPPPPAAQYAGATTGQTRPSRQKSTGTWQQSDSDLHFHWLFCVTFRCFP